MAGLFRDYLQDVVMFNFDLTVKPIRQTFQVADDDGERGAQLVRNLIEKFRFKLCEVLGLFFFLF